MVTAVTQDGGGAAFAPRLALVLISIFSNLVDRAFAGVLIPLLGLILFP